MIEAKNLKPGMVLVIGHGISYKVERVCLLIFHDGSLRVKVKHIDFWLVVPEATSRGGYE